MREEVRRAEVFNRTADLVVVRDVDAGLASDLDVRRGGLEIEPLDDVGKAPDVIGAGGVAIRLPIADFDELGASANALVHVDHAIYALTGRKLTFGGFDVGSAWVNILLEHAANDTFSTIVGAFLGAGAAYGKQCYERWKLLREAQAAGIAAADADATLDLALRKYLRDRAEEIAASVKGGTVTPETIERVMLGMQGIGRIVERGGTWLRARLRPTRSTSPPSPAGAQEAASPGGSFGCATRVRGRNGCWPATRRERASAARSRARRQRRP